MKISDLPYFEKWFIIGTLLGIISGFASLAFYYLIKIFEILFLNLFAGYYFPSPLGEGGTLNYSFIYHFNYLIPISTTLGAFISGLIVFRFAPEAEGHGTDAAIDAYHRKAGKVRYRIIPVKAIASAITIGSGGSAGREGPTAQISSGIGSLLANVLKLTPEDRRKAVAVGIGAGIGTIFKAPIGGAILASEVLYKRDLEPEIIYPAIVASAIGYVIFGSIVGFTPIFGYYSLPFSPLRLPLYAILGVVAGFASIFYVKTFYGTRNFFKNLKISNYFKPAIGGLLSGLIFLFFPELMGIGYGWIDLLIYQKFDSFFTYGIPFIIFLLLLFVFKVLATSLTIGSGASGGVFAPGLFMGGILGALLGIIFSIAFPSIVPTIAPFVIIGMLSFFGAAAKAPISVMIMVIEMTGGLQLLPGAMIAVAIAYLVSGDYTIYSSQVPTRKDSPAHAGEYNVPVLKTIKIGDAKIRDISIFNTNSVERALTIMRINDLFSLPVIDKERNFLGIVFMSDIKDSPPNDRIEKYVRKGVAYVSPNSTGEEIWNVLTSTKSTWIPVVQKGKFLGVILLNDFVELYREKLKTFFE